MPVAARGAVHCVAGRACPTHSVSRLRKFFSHLRDKLHQSVPHRRDKALYPANRMRSHISPVGESKLQ